jgi:hypothetical protein
MLRIAFAVCALGLLGSHAAAEQLTYRYLPTSGAGTTSLYRGSDGAAGTRRAWWGGAQRPANGEARATHVVTFRHPYNGQNVSVPITFPDGTPRIEHLADRIVYNYGAYSITSRFLSDGSVEVTYNSGLFRALRLQ